LKRRTETAITLVVIAIAAVALFAYFNYGSGILEIKMTDPPTDWGEATQVYLNYSSIEIHKAQPDNESGWFTVFDNSAWINLTRTLNVNQTIGSKNLQAGVYNLIRFQILSAKVTVGGKNYTAALVPSGKVTIAIKQGGIRIATGQTATLLIDTNVRVEGSRAESTFRIEPAAGATPV